MVFDFDKQREDFNNALDRLQSSERISRLEHALDMSIEFLKKHAPPEPEHNCCDPNSQCDMICVEWSEYCKVMTLINKARS